MAVYAVVSAIFGVALLLMPVQLIGLYGASPDALATVMGRHSGGAYIGLAVMAWVGRNADASKSRDAMVLGVTIINAFSVIAAALGALSGVFNALTWLQVLLYALFTVAYILAGKASMSTSPA